MDSVKIKVICERISKGIKHMFFTVLTCLTVYNNPLVSMTKELEAFEKMLPKVQKQRQFEWLKETLIYACQDVSFYT